MTLVQKEIKKVYLGSTQVRPEFDGWDYATTTVTNTGSNTQYYYGVCFRPNKNCSLDKVKFLGGNATAGTLKISQGDYASAGGTTYSINTSNSTNGLYELGTPYQLTANTNYVVSFKWSGSGTNAGMNNGMAYPVTGENVEFRWGTHSDSATQITNYCYAISGIHTN